ncbi:hypothetical protein [Alloprevotella rava]|uniref:Fimbrillin family protein n=1 Tax=Alloprevotella rava TaxID=671218 RepID=A0A7W5YFQ8_9BACT|nr:hypothetical protein [Alloprevotella rava]MBB3702386.1 hypothetical protein [Alloprevotella rava]
MKVNKIYLNLLTVGMLSFMAGCAGDENIDHTEGKETDNSSELTAFSCVSSNRLMKYAPRTSMGGHQYLTGSDFYWEPGDQIYVKDDNNALQKSTMTNISATQPTARFQVPGAYTAQNSYEVYYTGASAGATSDKVVISTTQTQTAPNTAKHIGGVGDCGTSTATRVGDHFEFMLNHKAAYLCFLPRVTNAELGKNIYLTKIVVKSDNAIAGDYTLSMGGLSSAPTANAANEITLTTLGTGMVNGPWDITRNIYTQVSAPGFPLSNTITNLATNAAYMVIAPGTHSLTVDYYIKDPVTNVEGVITKTLPVGKNYEANKVYDVTANLTPKDYSDRKYYMWDAQQEYWYGVSDYPTVIDQSNSNYAQNNSDPRWYNGVNDAGATQASHSCQACPNVNEAFWYIMQGDPHWDGETLWSMMSHLYKGGIWLKKKTEISGFNAESYTDPTSGVAIDYRRTHMSYVNTPISGKPVNITHYFYLPALGSNFNGTLYNVGVTSNYWLSSPQSSDVVHAYNMYFIHNHIHVDGFYRYNGYPLWTGE